MLRWDHNGFDKKNIGTCYIKLVFFHPVGAAGHVVHSNASRMQNVDALFFMLGGTDMDLTKGASGKVMPSLCFCIRWDLSVT
jgi:hypothetical protein